MLPTEDPIEREALLTSLRNRRLVVILALGLYGVVSMQLFAVHLRGLFFLESLEQLQALERQVQIASYVAKVSHFQSISMFTFLAAAIAWSFWVKRAYQNILEVFDGVPHETPGWAAALYWIPLVNLFKPYRNMLEIWRAGAAPEERGRVGFLFAWWAIYLLSFVHFSVSGPSAGAMRGAHLLALGDDVFDVLAALAAILVVHRVTRAHQERARDGSGVAEVFS